MATIWIDLDNAPHVPFFAPIIAAFRAQGHDTRVTVRDFGYTRALAERHGIPCDLVGRHPGGNPVRKVLGLGSRAIALARWARGRRIDVAAGHGSRGLVLAGALLRVPVVTLYDYEFVSTSLFNRLSARVLLPDLLPDELLRRMRLSGDRVARYPGLKEEVYLGGFTPDPSIRAALGVPEDDTLVVVRPPATTAHYHNAMSEKIMEVLYDKIASADRITALVVPRTAAQAEKTAEAVAHSANIRVLTSPVDGLNLIWNADLVVGGGGTMNREAAVLGVPVYSVFMGRVGAIDRALARQGRLVLVRAVCDVDRVEFVRRSRPGDSDGERRRSKSRQLIDFISREILAAARPRS